MNKFLDRAVDVKAVLRKSAASPTFLGKALVYAGKGLLGFNKLPVLIKAPLTTLGLLELANTDMARSYLTKRMHALGQDLGSSVVGGATKAGKPAIDQLKADLSAITKVDADAQKERVSAINTLFNNVQTQANKLGEGLGLGISRTISPIVSSLGIAALGAGGGGVVAHYLAGKITRNRLLRTLITMAGAGAGGVLAGTLGQRYLVPHLYEDKQTKPVSKTKTAASPESETKSESNNKSAKAETK